MNKLSNQNKLYNVGLYIRLSREDGDKEESSSISNQRDLLRNYLKSHLELNYIEEYVDDGYSGMNFDRPAFNKMLMDIRKGKINTIITKDLSRLGRDYIETGYYVQKYFPSNNVRYLSVLDDIDTEKDSGMNEIAPFKSIINDMYVKDISNKIKSVVYQKKKEGKCLCTTTPYGYMKDPEDKYHLIINEDEAKIVREMFDLYLQGNGLTKIAQIFTQKGYEVPGVSRNIGMERKTALYYAWKQTTISRMLRNKVYVGDLEQLKRKTLNYKSKIRKTVPVNERVLVQNTHEPIISRETFAKAQEILSHNASFKGTKHDYLFKGLLYCGDCGSKLLLSYSHYIYKKTGKYKYTTMCYTYSKLFNEACTRHSNSIEALEKVLLKTIKQVCSQYLDKELEQEMVEETLREKKNTSRKEDLNRKILEIDTKIEDIDRSISDLYMDKSKGIITVDQFISISNNFNISKSELQSQKEEYISIIQNKKYSKLDAEKLKKLAKSFTSMKKINKDLLNQLIEKVTITEDSVIKIHYKFKELNEVADTGEILQYKTVFGRGTKIS